MNKEQYVKISNEKLANDNSRKILISQIEKYYEIKDKYKINKHNYKVGDSVYLPKGTLLHGTYKNIEGLKEIVKSGLISSWFIDGRMAKYPSSVGVWNLKKDYYLNDYIDFYSGGTIKYRNMDNPETSTDVIAYSDMNNIMEIIKRSGYFSWKMEQTKESRFLPSLTQDKVQIGIIINGNNPEIKELLNGDILTETINDEDVKEFVNSDYYNDFIRLRKEKDDFFTDRESAILFGIPAYFIEGILVGRIYEKDATILNEIKELLPDCYICNLDGKVVLE